MCTQPIVLSLFLFSLPWQTEKVPWALDEMQPFLIMLACMILFALGMWSVFKRKGLI